MLNKSETVAVTGKEKVAAIIVLGVLPLILLVGYSHVLITPIGMIDPWLYLGYKLDLIGHLKAFVGYYYGSRLPALLPGSLLYSALPPLAANYVDHLLFYCISVVSLFLVVKAFAGVRSGLVAAILMGYYCFFLRAVGWDYIDGAGISYLLATLVFLSYATSSSRPKTFFLLGGGFFGLAVFTNLFLAIFAPVFALFLWTARNHGGGKEFAVEQTVAGSGLVIATLALCLVNFIMVGDFVFFEPSLAFVKRNINLFNENPWRKPGAVWLFEARHLVLPALVFVGSSLLLILHLMKQKAQVKAGKVSMELAFVTVCCIMIFCQFVGMNVLQIYYYSSYLIPLTFAVIGIWSQSFVQKLSTREFAVAVAFLMILMTLSLSHEMVRRMTDVGAQQIFWPTALFVVALATLLLSRKRLAGLLLSVCVLAFAYPSLSSTASKVSSAIPNTKASDSFLAVVQGVHLVKQADPDCGIRFWYDARETFGPAYRGISSAFLWGSRLVNESYPSLKDVFNSSRLVELKPKTRVLVFSEEEKSLEEINRALRPIGLVAAQVRRDSIVQGNIRFKTLLVQVDAPGVPATIKEQFQSAVELYLKSDEALIASLQRNCYGRSTPDKALMSRGALELYCPLDPRDHLATPFIDVRQPKTGQESWVQLTVPRPQAGENATRCTLTLQDDLFRDLMTVPYSAEQRWNVDNSPLQWYLRLPVDTKEIRVRINAPPNAEAPIPMSIGLKQAIF